MLSVTRSFFFSLALMLSEGGVSMHNPFYCFTQDPLKPQFGMFASTTGYEISRGQSINENVSTCTPSKFWMVARHGMRLPDPGEFANIFQHNEHIHRGVLSNYENGRTSLCASDIELIKNWRLGTNWTLEFERHLTSSGWNEMEGLAQRYQSAFPSLLPSIYSPTDYFFRHTYAQRTQASLRAFADGLFGVGGSEQVQFEDVPEPDTFLLPWYFCTLHTNATTTRPESIAFRAGPEYQEMLSQVSAKLGFHGSHTLRAIEVETLFTICKYEQTSDLSSMSPLCAAFSVANFQVLEYYQDLEFYYRNGYGFPDYRRLIENLPCFLMQDMLRFIQSNDVNDHKARIFGSGGIPILYMMVNFGAFEDDVPLTRHNFAQQTQRLWKTSSISQMGANLAVIRYDCTDGDNDILFLYNERPLSIAGCEPNGLCKQSLILKRFDRFLNANCADIYCSNS